MTAHTRLLGSGPQAKAVCDECDWAEAHDRTQDAQNAARDHNRRAHAYPEQTLEITEEET